MRILVTGSRTWAEEEIMWAAFCKYVFSVMDKNTLVHGGAAGADLMAARQAESFGWEIEEHKADWNKYGKRAGFIRNSEMVNLGADICLAFIVDNSKGATMTADLAEKKGIKTIRFEI